MDMPRGLFLFLSIWLVACQSSTNEAAKPIETNFMAKRQDANLDQQIQPLLSTYFAVMQHLQAADTANLNEYGAKMIQIADSMAQQTLSKDTATQNSAVQGLLNIQSEMEAVLMETDPNQRIQGAQMLSLHWIEFLGSIGYEKQRIYIFSDAMDNQWIGLNKTSLNPYLLEGNKTYTAIQVLQELK
jgi:hypothetical protein